MPSNGVQCAAVVAFMFAGLLAAGCSDAVVSAPNANAPIGAAVVHDPRADVLDVPAGGPATETPGTTSAAKSDVSKAQQSRGMPMPGQANDHSTLSPKASQKALPPQK